MFERPLVNKKFREDIMPHQPRVSLILVCAILTAASSPWAQQVDEAEDTATPAPVSTFQEINIFEESQIELLDLEALQEEIAERFGGVPVRMTLDECIRIALESNQDILVSVFDPMAAESDIKVARGEFDPVLTATFNFFDAAQSTGSQIFAFSGLTSTENAVTNTQLSLGGLLHWGTRYDLSIAADRTIGTFSGFEEEYTAVLSLSLTQPLLRGAGRKVNMVSIRSAENSKRISEAQVMLTVLNTTGDVMKAYWDLVGTINTLVVRQESLDNAHRLHNISAKRNEIGVAAYIEVVQARAGIASRQGDYITALTAIGSARDFLIRSMGLMEDGHFSTVAIIPIDRPAEGEIVLDEKASVQKALENRPEIQSAILSVKNADLERLRSRNNMLPQLDIDGSYTTGGRARHVNDTFLGLRKGQDETYSIGIVASVPIGNRAARHTHQRAMAAKEQAEQRLIQAKYEAALQVRTSMRNVLSNRSLVEANLQATRLQKVSVLAEERKLQLGTSTSQDVLDIQEDLTGAQVAEEQARVELEKSRIDLKVAEGTLLEEQGIEFDFPEGGRPLTFFESFRLGWDKRIPRKDYRVYPSYK